jgi:hypothetical protein
MQNSNLHPYVFCALLDILHLPTMKWKAKYPIAKSIAIMFASRLNRDNTERIIAIGMIIHFDIYDHDNAAQTTIMLIAATMKSGLALANPR